ncbi:ferritin-like domain-containing protein [Thiomicrospira microaerophila]|uniref:ferritin-like domain-containing protein n=1 Tax=Thiomicrospira microaerophila TaxID=406020 RepID=UPI00200C5D19|nr:ferritin-like domain-containing protein [Thiomicrospira microaerophila]UQB41455.1 ferritin-like domain-containing protein [Thiomicrospira microaerophila]
MAKINLFSSVYECLLCTDLSLKIKQLDQLLFNWSEQNFEFSPLDAVMRIAEPGRPSKPDLVAPRNLVRRGLGSKEGHAALMHAIAHIEFNAINLALDAIYRFQTMPFKYYQDWLGVAGEEAYHFQMIREHLDSMGHDYGDFPAHNGLWLTTYETDHDVLVRMAMVPRTLEARGLDVTPAMIKKLRAIGDHRGVEILKILLRDEVGHVAVGTYWYRYLCEQRALNPFDEFQRILSVYFHGDIRGPFNYDARREAGFSEQEIQWLKQLEQQSFDGMVV